MRRAGRSGPAIAGVLAVALVAAPARRATAEGEGEKKNGADTKKTGSVLTFYGLRKLEEDPQVSDEEKLGEWQAFIERANEQIGYAKKAVDRWKNAARLRLIEVARNTDRDPSAKVEDKLDRWKEVVRLYPKDPEARNAQKRVAHWTAEETKRRVAAAEEVERARRPKVERIQAWMQVLGWVEKGAEAKAANKRIDTLQAQLFSEAQSVDGIARVDDRTKLAAWRDVLAGRPTREQEKVAEQRAAELEASLPRPAPAEPKVAPAQPDAGLTDPRG